MRQYGFRGERIQGARRWCSLVAAGLAVWFSGAVLAEECGDANGDGAMSLSDALDILNNLAGNVDTIPCDLEEADVDGNGRMTVADSIYLMNFLFGGGEPPRCDEGPVAEEEGLGATVSVGEVRRDGTSVEIDVLVVAHSDTQVYELAYRPGAALSASGRSFTLDSALDAEINFERSDGDVILLSVGNPIHAGAFIGESEDAVTLGVLSFELASEDSEVTLEWVTETEGDCPFYSVVIGESTAEAELTFGDGVEPEPTPVVGFVRGDLDGDSLPSIDDFIPLLTLVLGDGTQPIGCDGEGHVEAADVNDNEHVTIADFLMLRDHLFRESQGLDPDCKLDTTDDTDGFDEIDEEYRVSAASVEVLPDAASSGRDVLISLVVDTPEDLTAMQLVVEYDPNALTPYSESEGGVVLGSSVGQPQAREVEPGKLLLTFFEATPDEILMEATGGVFVSIGALRFHLKDFAVFRPLIWSQTAEGEFFDFHATLVDTEYRDHRPQLLVGEYEFARGNANSDVFVDISDPTYILKYLFNNGPAPDCEDAADANNDGEIDISDAIFVLSFLFMGGETIPQPFPQCGLDQGTIDLLGCEEAGKLNACFEQ
ncbi:MAG: dockerin type I domain-containing protein [Planctomycetota bacterium]